MIVKYDALSSFEEPVFSLCNPGSVYRDGYITDTIGVIPSTTDVECIYNFNAPSELNFRIYQSDSDDETENEYLSKIYNAIENKRLIFAKDVGYFVIETVDVQYDENGHHKDVNAKSAEQEISQKCLPYIANNTYRFYDPVPPAGDEKNKPIFNMIAEVLPRWTVGHVDDTIALKYRTFEDVDFSKNCLGFMLEDMQDAYECIFIFDTVHRVIDVYDQNNYVKLTHIHLTENDLVKSMSYNENSNDLYTAITVIGGENITIAGINPLGTNTLYNFNYYLDWMSNSLREKVKTWQTEVENNEAPYYNMSVDYYKKLTEANNTNLELERLNIQLDLYTKCKENIVAENGFAVVDKYNAALEKNGGKAIIIKSDIQETIAMIDGLITEVNAKITATQTTLDNINTSLNTLKGNMKAVHDKLAITKYFTQEEYDELSYYIFEGNYNDEFIIITDIMTHEEKFEQMKILYDRAKKQLKNASYPTQEYNVDTGSFIFDERFKEWAEQIETGCLINIEFSTGDVASLFLSSMTINYSEKSVSLSFGNRFNKFDPKSLFNQMLGNISKSSNSLNYIKDTIHPIKDGAFSAFEQAISTSRNLTMDEALASQDEEFYIDGTGCTARRRLENGEYDPRQLKIIGKNIVFTRDGWDTCSTAIGELVLPDGRTTYGINGETILGNIIMGSELHILDKDGNDIFKIADDKISAAIADSETKTNTKIEQTANTITASVEQKMKDSIAASEETTASEIEQSAESIEATVSKTYQTKADAETERTSISSEIKQSADSIEQKVAATDGRVTNLSTTVDGITLSTTDTNTGTATLKIGNNTFTVVNPDGVTSEVTEQMGTELQGYVKFTNLSDPNDKATQINGSHIITGSISADKIESGKFVSPDDLGENGSTVIDGSRITTGKISADHIETAGFLSPGDIGPYGGTKIDGGRIQSGRISAEFIDADNIEAKKVSANAEIRAPKIIGGRMCVEIIDDRTAQYYYPLVIAYNSDNNVQVSSPNMQLDCETNIYGVKGINIRPGYERDSPANTVPSAFSVYTHGVVVRKPLDTLGISATSISGTSISSSGSVSASSGITSSGDVTCVGGRIKYNGGTQYDIPKVAVGNRSTAYISTGNGTIGNDGSSIRYKHDIKPVRTPSLDPHNLYDVSVVQFKWNEGFFGEAENWSYDTDDIGMIAEDIAEHFPAAAVYNAEGTPENWCEKQMIPPMLALIQEQKKMIDDLTARVEKLESTSKNVNETPVSQEQV